LEAGRDRVLALGFLGIPLLGQLRVTGHQIASDQRHLDARFPLVLQLFRGPPVRFVVGVEAGLAMLLDPRQGCVIFACVVDRPVDPSGDLGHVDRFDPHVEVILEEGPVDNRSGDPHRDPADGKV
jgi:hypothetical protein